MKSSLVAVSAALVLSAPLAAQRAAPPDLRVTTAPPTSIQTAKSEEETEAEMREIFRKEGMFGLVTRDMSRDERLILCGIVAENYAAVAAEEINRAKRQARLADVWQLEQRLRAPLEAARERLGDKGVASARREAGQAMTLMSMAPDPGLAEEIRAEEDVMYVFIGNIAKRCGTMLDTMGIASPKGEPSAAYLEKNTRFRFRGADYETVFADTGLTPYAAQMCREGPAPHFAGAPLEARGTNGMSLLDWATECDDRASFEALIAAGFDLDATGLFDDPPLVRSASEKRLWYLERLLDAGVSPDTMGRSDTALMKATKDLDAINFGGDERAAFDLLRSRGATLDFPNFRESMWKKWGLHQTRWDLILQHWDEFGSDPVELGSLVEAYLAGEWAWAKEQHRQAAQQVKALLIEQHGVCFPVGRTFELEKDDRGFAVQPDCFAP